MSVDETEVNITRNKKLLERIRQEGEKANGRRNDGLGSQGHVEGRGSGNIEDARRTEGIDQRDSRGTQGNARPDRTVQGSNQGVRPLDGTGLDANQGPDSGNRRTEKRLSIVETPEEKEERQRELARQRVRAFRDRERQAKEEREAQNVALRNGPQFNLKLPFGKHETEPIRLFSKQDAEDELPRLKDIYFRGSGLLDDVLEIVVKDHEPVQIWQLSEEEAETLAGMHLERAKKDKAAARSARKLLEIYDRLYFYMIVFPRMKKTGSHIAEHKGLSFR